MIRDSKTGDVLAEMFAHGHREMVLPGGRGGRGNASFKTALNKAPQIAENGEEGQERWVEMELKLVADVGIIGVPNAGKSTLLSNISNAKPKIADYPFTTIVPNLGVVERDFERMVFADIPGLLEGASEGIGLGFEFLRHVKRTRVLVHVLDCTSENVLEEYDAIRNEIFLFDEEVGDKPELVALNKVDVSDEAAERALRLQELFVKERGIDAHVISAYEGQGTAQLVGAVKEVWAALPAPDYEAQAEAAAARRVARPADGKALDDFTIVDTPYAFVVEGAAIERFVQMTNWDYFESFKRFPRRCCRCPGWRRPSTRRAPARAIASSSASTSSSGAAISARRRCSTRGRRSRMRNPRGQRDKARVTGRTEHVHLEKKIRATPRSVVTPRTIAHFRVTSLYRASTKGNAFALHYNRRRLWDHRPACGWREEILPRVWNRRSLHPAPAPRCGVMIETPPRPLAPPAPPPVRGCSSTPMRFGECPRASFQPKLGMRSHQPPPPSHHSSQYWLPSELFPYL